MIDVIDLFNACLYIQDNLEADLSLLLLARISGLSRFRFHRVFKAWRGETLHEYVTRMRMEKAAFELSYPVPRSSQRSIKAIAFASGYKSLSSFSHAFSAYAQISPREFRNRALRGRPQFDRKHASKDVLGPYRVAIRNEPSREIAVFDPVTRAGPPLGNAGLQALSALSWVGGDRYGVELLPNLFVRSRGVRSPAGKAATLSCVGVDIEDWKASANHRPRASHGQVPRTTIKLDAGRYAVIEGSGSIAALYRGWSRGFDAWLAATGECPRAGRLYIQFRQPESEDAPLSWSLHVPLEETPLGMAERSGAGRYATADGVLSDSRPSQERARSFLRQTPTLGAIPAAD